MAMTDSPSRSPLPVPTDQEDTNSLFHPKPVIQFTFPVEPGRPHALQWEEEMLVMSTLDCLYFLNPDTEQEAAPTYLRMPSTDPQQGPLEDLRQTHHSWARVNQGTITCGVVSAPMQMKEDRNRVRRMVALATSQGVFQLFVESLCGEWSAGPDLLPLLRDHIAEAVSLEWYFIQCVCWVQIDHESSYLVAASKSGAIYAFHVQGDEAKLVQWVAMAGEEQQVWVSALSCHCTAVQRDRMTVQVTMGFSHGGVSTMSLCLSPRPPASGEIRVHASEKVLASAGTSPVARVSICPWDQSIGWVSGCRWYRLEAEGRGQVQTVMASTTLMTDFAWREREKQILVTSLDGEVALYNCEGERQDLYHYEAPNWGLYGIAISPSGLHVATIAKTPKGEEKMFNTLSSKSVLDVRLPQPILEQNDEQLLHMIRTEWTWEPEPATYWDKHAVLFQAHRVTWYGDTLVPSLWEDWKSTPHEEQMAWRGGAFLRVQFLYSFVAQCQRRGVALPTLLVETIRRTLWERNVQRSLERFLQLSSTSQKAILQDGDGLRAVSVMQQQLAAQNSHHPPVQALLQKIRTCLASSCPSSVPPTCGMCQGAMNPTECSPWKGSVTCQAGHRLDCCVFTSAPLLRSGNLFCYGCRQYAHPDVRSDPDLWSWTWASESPSPSSEGALRCPYCRLPLRSVIPF